MLSDLCAAYIPSHLAFLRKLRNCVQGKGSYCAAMESGHGYLLDRAEATSPLA